MIWAVLAIAMLMFAGCATPNMSTVAPTRLWITGGEYRYCPEGIESYTAHYECFHVGLSGDKHGLYSHKISKDTVLLIEYGDTPFHRKIKGVWTGSVSYDCPDGIDRDGDRLYCLNHSLGGPTRILIRSITDLIY